MNKAEKTVINLLQARQIGNKPEEEKSDAEFAEKVLRVSRELWGKTKRGKTSVGIEILSGIAMSYDDDEIRNAVWDFLKKRKSAANNTALCTVIK